VHQKTAQAISGHKDPNVFQRYNIIDQADLSDATRKLQDAATRRREQQARPVLAEHRSGLVS
jgi:hypothetical protein